MAKSGCHANSVGGLHNATDQGDGLNLTLLNLTLASLLLFPLSLTYVGARVTKLGSKSVLLG